jgi:superfamily II DNA or RNA helicase
MPVMTLPFTELSLKTSYHKGEDDIAAEFYTPCLERTIYYDRAVGFFRSSIFLISWPTLTGFIERNGKMRVLCSHILEPEDIEALESGYTARIDERLAESLLNEVRSLLGDPILREPATILAGLVANRTIDFRIAIFRHDRPHRLFHDKLGLFYDSLGNTIMFKGSMNETWTGLSNDGNLESIDVFASWDNLRDSERIQRERSYFEALWSNHYPGLLVREFPKVAREELEAVARSQSEILPLDTIRPDSAQTQLELRPHQIEALASWRDNKRRGILEHATGSGKTITAIAAIRESLQRREIPVVLAPTEILFAQWHRELHKFLGDIDLHVLRCGGGFSTWRSERLLRDWSRPGNLKQLILSTLPTASSDEFRSMLLQGDHLFLVADEVHRLGSRVASSILDWHVGPRLGLSATPRRAGDPAGTAALISFFAGILQPPYTIHDAIRDGHLSPYFYKPHVITLTIPEQDEWLRLSRKIGQISSSKPMPDEPQPNLDRLLIERARIVKSAQNKVGAATDLLLREYEPGSRWIVYCDSQEQLSAIGTALTSSGIETLEYHSAMEGDQHQTLRWFERAGGILVAIRCLDEGVDIPSVSHALILASSKNPREFIQRRGRVLRRAPGKTYATIHDVIVVPRRTPQTQRSDFTLIEGELARAVEFGRHAVNPTAIADLQTIAIDWEIDIHETVEEGIEDIEDSVDANQ